METGKLIYHDKHNNILQVGDYLQHDDNFVCCIVLFDIRYRYPIRVCLPEDNITNLVDFYPFEDLFGVSEKKIILMTKEEFILWKLEN